MWNEIDFNLTSVNLNWCVLIAPRLLFMFVRTQHQTTSLVIVGIQSITPMSRHASFFTEVKGTASNYSAYYGYPELWILRYPAHRHQAVPSPGFELTTLWLRVRRSTPRGAIHGVKALTSHVFPMFPIRSMVIVTRH
jgi:hypothetical protein